MQTAKPKSKRRTIILAAVVIAVIGGGAAAALFFLGNTGRNTGRDFTIFVKQGNPNSPSGTWSSITQDTVLLNGSSTRLVVGASVPAFSSFNDILTLSFSSPLAGVTGLIARSALHPAKGNIDWTGLNVTAASNAPSRQQYYNFTVTATGGGITHVATFPLLIRTSVLRIYPVSLQTTKNSSFVVGLGINDIYSFYGFQFYLNYNASLLTAESLSIASAFLPPNGFIALSSINNTIGQVAVSATMLGSPCYVSVPCIDSPGSQVTNFANVTFTANATNAGISSLTLTQTILTLLHGQGDIVPVNANIGYHATTADVSVVNRTSVTSVNCVPPSGIGATGFTTQCTATVSDSSPGALNPTRVVRFYNGTSFIQSCNLAFVSNGVSSCSVPFAIPVGTPSGTPQMIIADYLGDESHDVSSGSFDVTVT